MPSENGWEPAWANQAQLVWCKIPGAAASMQFLKGLPAAVLTAFAADYNAYVETLNDADCASYTPTNSVATSNHLNGTAMDMRWLSHPFRVKGTFSATQMRVIRELLDFYEDTVFWAGDWVSPVDEMHWQMDYGTFRDQARVSNFVARKIRADGFSTFRRGNAPLPGDPANVLARATALSLSRATAILPQVVDGLRASECNTPRRIAAWLAQIGHESDNFNATEEYANGDTSTDRWKYKGRTWIQITWYYNYREFSKWCYDRGLVDYPKFFVDNPRALADQRWAGLGPAWYWTVARSDINALCDAGDFDTVTYRINGGQNGAADRRARYSRALALGDELLRLLDIERSDPTIEELLMADTLYPSVSIYKEPGEGAKYTLAQLIQSIDGMRHRETVEESALRGNLDDIHRVFRVAARQGEYKDDYTVNYAKSVIAELKRVNPSALEAYLNSKGIQL